MSDSSSGDAPQGRGTVASTQGPELSSTVDTFVNRIRRKLKAQEQQQGIEQIQTEERHRRMLQAMTAIRRAMSESCKLELGERFGLDLEVNDFDGWPQVELLLLDQLDPANPPVGLRVVAKDENNDGGISFCDLKGGLYAKVNMSEPENLDKISPIVKRSLRVFLDLVESYVLNPLTAEELLEQQTKHIEVNEADLVSKKLENENLFTDDLIGNRNQVSIDDD